MTDLIIAHQRLQNQHLAGNPFDKPEDVVSASFDPAIYNNGLDPFNEALVSYIVVLNGQVIGRWRRIQAKNEINFTTNLVVALRNAELAVLKAAAEDYSRFMEMPVTLDIG